MSIVTRLEVRGLGGGERRRLGEENAGRGGRRNRSALGSRKES